MDKCVSYMQLGKMMIQCSCGYSGIAINEKCKKCKKEPEIDLDRQNIIETIQSIKEMEDNNNSIINVEIDEIIRKKKNVTFTKRIESLVLDKATGEVVHKRKGREESLTYKKESFNCTEDYMHKNIVKENIESLIPFIKKWFEMRGIHYIKPEDVLKQSNGYEGCFMLIRFPVLQNLPFSGYSSMPERFFNQLDTIKTGDELWRVFTNHSAKTVKESIKTVYEFNDLMFFGPMIKRPENIVNLFSHFANKTTKLQQYQYGHLIDIGEHFKRKSYEQFVKGLKVIQNMHSDETVWVNRIISLAKKKKYWSGDMIIDYITDIGNMYVQTEKVLNTEHLNEKKSIEELHNYLQRNLLKARHKNRKITYTDEEKNLEFETEDYRIVLARDSHELLDIGEDLNICVGSYGQSAAAKNCIIALLYLKGDNVPAVCIEIRNKSIVQAKMAYNQKPYKDLRNQIENWAKNWGLKINTRDLIADKNDFDIDIDQNGYREMMQRMRTRDRNMIEDLMRANG